MALCVLACTAAVLASASAASAVSVAVGPGGRALMTWNSGAGLRFAERTPAGSFAPARTIAPPKVYPTFIASGPGGAASVLAYDESSAATRGLIAIRRADGAPAFDAPIPFLAGPQVHVLSAASNARGDGAVLVKPDPEHLLLLTARGGGPLGSPQAIPTVSENAKVALSAGGRLVVAYYEFSGSKGVRALLGAIGSPLGAPQRLSTGTFTDVGAATDDRGTTTIAFVRTDERHRSRGAELVARRAGSDGRFGATRVVATGGPPVTGAGFASFTLAAAGATTALAFDANDADGRLGIAIARGSGSFGRVARPTSGKRGSFAMQPSNPSVAVDRAGDVVLAYNFGIYGGAVHVTRRRAGSAFSSPRVISSLGNGGAPVAALLSDRTALVAWDNGRAARYTTRIAGRRPDDTPPRASVTLLPGTAAELRKHNTAGVSIGCSEACLMSVRATLRTKTGRTILGEQNIVLGRSTVTKRFAFDPARRSGRAGDGSTLRVTVDVENASGASSETVKQLTLR